MALAKKDKIIRAIFDNIQELTAEDIVKSQQFLDMLKERTPIAIEDAHKSNKIFATLFEINDSTSYIEIHKNNWISALESILAMYVTQEDYDTCKKIAWLIQEIKDKQKKIPLKK